MTLEKAHMHTRLNKIATDLRAAETWMIAEYGGASGLAKIVQAHRIGIEGVITALKEV